MTFQALMQMPESKRIARLAEHIWPHEARILAAVASGIRSVDSKSRFSTHVSGMATTQPTFTVAFFKAMKDGGFPVDEVGVSYYLTSSSSPEDRLQAFKDMAKAVQRELGRPVFIAEFGYPGARMQRILKWNDTVPGYPTDSRWPSDFRARPCYVGKAPEGPLGNSSVDARPPIGHLGACVTFQGRW